MAKERRGWGGGGGGGGRGSRLKKKAFRVPAQNEARLKMKRHGFERTSLSPERERETQAVYYEGKTSRINPPTGGGGSKAADPQQEDTGTRREASWKVLASKWNKRGNLEPGYIEGKVRR